MFKLMLQIIVYQRYRCHVFIGAIKYAWHLAGTTQAAARTFPHIRTQLSIELKTLHCITPLSGLKKRPLLATRKERVVKSKKYKIKYLPTFYFILSTNDILINEHRTQ